MQATTNSIPNVRVNSVLISHKSHRHEHSFFEPEPRSVGNDNDDDGDSTTIGVRSSFLASMFFWIFGGSEASSIRLIQGKEETTTSIWVAKYALRFGEIEPSNKNNHGYRPFVGLVFFQNQRIAGEQDDDDVCAPHTATTKANVPILRP